MRKACFAPKPVNDNSSVKLESTLQTSMLRQSSFDPPCWASENILIMTSFTEKYLKGNWTPKMMYFFKKIVNIAILQILPLNTAPHNCRVSRTVLKIYGAKPYQFDRWVRTDMVWRHKFSVYSGPRSFFPVYYVQFPFKSMSFIPKQFSQIENSG